MKQPHKLSWFLSVVLLIISSAYSYAAQEGKGEGKPKKNQEIKENENKKSDSDTSAKNMSRNKSNKKEKDSASAHKQESQLQETIQETIPVREVLDLLNKPGNETEGLEKLAVFVNQTQKNLEIAQKLKKGLLDSLAQKLIDQAKEKEEKDSLNSVEKMDAWVYVLKIVSGTPHQKQAEKRKSYWLHQETKDRIKKANEGEKNKSLSKQSKMALWKQVSQWDPSSEKMVQKKIRAITALIFKEATKLEKIDVPNTEKITLWKDVLSGFPTDKQKKIAEERIEELEASSESVKEDSQKTPPTEKNKSLSETKDGNSKSSETAKVQTAEQQKTEEVKPKNQEQQKIELKTSEPAQETKPDPILQETEKTEEVKPKQSSSLIQQGTKAPLFEMAVQNKEKSKMEQIALLEIMNPSIAKDQQKDVLMIFMKSDCSECVTSLEELEKRFQALKSKGFLIISVLMDNNISTVKQFTSQADKTQISFPIISDRFGIISKKYGAQKPFSFVFIERSQTVKFSTDAVTPQDMEKIIFSPLSQFYM